MSRPLGSTATPASSGFPATTGRSASERRDGTQCLRFLPLAGSLSRPPQRRSPYRRSPSHVPCKSRRPGSRRLYAGHHLASNAGTRQAHPEGHQDPRFRCHLTISTPQQRTPAPGHPGPGASGTSSWSPPDAITPRLFPNARHDSLQLTQLQGGLTPTPAGPTPEGQQASISRTAPPMSGSSYTTPPSAFVTHW